MAKVVSVTSVDELKRSLIRSFQSGHINFLIGSGASIPAIPAAGNVEEEIRQLLLTNESAGRARLAAFIGTVQGPTNSLIAGTADAAVSATLTNYKTFLSLIEAMLVRRRTTLLPKQATIFSTNYDLFVEQAAVDFAALNFNDGFSRVRSLSAKMQFSSRNFFRISYSTGNLYGYRAEIPSLNLIKLHGSLSWKKEGDEIAFEVRRKAMLAPGATPRHVRAFNEGFAVVLPQATKFQTTLLDRTYYDLLRIYSNELDRENALLVAFGFSFADEHIREITLRALKNPTARLVIAAFNEAAQQQYETIFASHSNVEVISPGPGAKMGFEEFNGLLQAVLPESKGPAP
jgi:hypothetical protein